MSPVTDATHWGPMASKEAEQGDDDDLANAVTVLDVIARGGARGQTFPSLQLATGLPKAELVSLLARLEQLGLVANTARRHHLGERLLELGVLTPIPREFRDAAVPFMGDLYAVTHETIHFGILVGTDVLYIEKLRGHQPAHVDTGVGLRMPASCTGLGKAMLAFSSPALVAEVLSGELPGRTPATITSPEALREELRVVAATGVAFDREENEIGVTCIAAPVLDAQQRAVGALSITGPVGRFRPDLYDVAVKTAARGLASVLANGK